jgi:hypothetical protein
MGFRIQTRTSWQQEPTVIPLTDVKTVMPSYPLIERKFFDDLVDRCRQHQHYFVETAMLKLVTDAGKELNPDLWIFVWAQDFKDRVFQLLFERNPDYGGKGALAAVAPPDMVEFLSSMKYNAILPTLTLLTSPDKMKQVAILVSRPQTHKEQVQIQQTSEKLGQFKNWIDNLKATPNVKGQWFPQNQVVNECPKCGSSMAGIAGNNTLYGILICPHCGHTLTKDLREIGQQPQPKK